MYIVKYGDKYLHNPLYNIVLSNTTVDIEDNSVGYCDFTIYPGHNLYDVIKERDEENEVVVMENDTVLFSGYIYEVSESFDTTKQIRCKGDLDFLNSSIVRPYSTRINNIGQKAPDTVDGYFAWLIQQHNDQVPKNKRFIVGINEGAKLDPNNFIYRESKQYPGTLSEINEKIISSLGGYLRVRWENDKRYIDLISKWTDRSTQSIQFGINLTDYNSTVDSQEIFTYVVPIGAKYVDTDYDYDDGYRESTDEQMVEDKVYYTLSYETEDKLKSFAEGVDYYESTDVAIATEDPYPYNGIRYCVYEITGYVLTEDTEMDESKQYYTISPTEVFNLTVFEEGVKYYEQVQHTFITSDTTPVEGIEYYTKVVSGDNITYQRASVTEFKSGETYYEQEYDYVLTTDATPQSNKKYYIYSYDSFSMSYNLKRFLRYETYYEAYEDVYKTTTDTTVIYNLNAELRYDEIYEFEDDVIYYEEETVYYKTEDEVPQNDKTYYTIRKHMFNEVSNQGKFKHYEAYYEYFEELDQSELHINIKSYDDEDYGNGYVKKGDMIYNKEAVKRFGYIGMIYKNEDIHETVYLKNKAIKELEKVLSPVKSIEVRAVDMHFLNQDSEPIKIGEYVRVKSLPHNLDSYFLCTSISLNLNNPQNSTYSFGTKIKTFTGDYVYEKEQIAATKDNVASLSNNVENLVQIVNKTEQTINNYKTDLSSLLKDISALKTKTNSTYNSLINEINARIQNDANHNDRLTTIESCLPNYINNILKIKNNKTIEVHNETIKIDDVSFKVLYPTYLQVNIECAFYVDTDETLDITDVYDEVNVEVQLVLNGVIQQWKPVETYLDGDHILSTYYGVYINSTDAQNFELRLKVSGGKIVIKQNNAVAYLSAQSISYIWDGSIFANDEIPIRKHFINVNSFSEDILFEAKRPDNPDAADALSYFAFSKYFDTISDNVETEVSTNA